MGDNSSLDRNVGKTKYEYCGECKRKTQKVFCHYSRTFGKDFYYWECKSCEKRIYVQQ